MTQREAIARALELMRPLAHLTPSEHQALHLRVVQCQTPEQIGGALDVTLETAQLHLSRARAKLLRYLEWANGRQARLERDSRREEERLAAEAELRELVLLRPFSGVENFREWLLRVIRGPRPSNPGVRQYDQLGREVLAHANVVSVDQDTHDYA